MPSPVDKIQKDRRYRGEVKGHCLPESSIVGGTVIDDVVDHRGIGIGLRDYRKREGEKQ